jgi:hypothetical protein
MIFQFFIILAIIIGVVKGWNEDKIIEEHPELGVEPSNSLFTFLFLDKTKINE